MNASSSEPAVARIRELRPDDAPAIQRLAADERIADTTSNIPHPYPEGAAAQWLQRVSERREAGRLRAFAILSQDSDDLLGVVTLMDIEDRTADVGYWVGVPYWGRGLATGALSRACEFARDELGLETLTARVLERNPASARVLERCGFQRVDRATSPCGYRQLVEPTVFYRRTL
jgi:RimJ/RimL family protein N-acetyltransferase